MTWYNVPRQGALVVQVWDSDAVNQDDFIGSARVLVEDIVRAPQCMLECHGKDMVPVVDGPGLATGCKVAMRVCWYGMD